jgi:hypothetical protein
MLREFVRSLTSTYQQQRHVQYDQQGHCQSIMSTSYQLCFLMNLNIVTIIATCMSASDGWILERVLPPSLTLSKRRASSGGTDTEMQIPHLLL